MFPYCAELIYCVMSTHTVTTSRVYYEAKLARSFFLLSNRTLDGVGVPTQSANEVLWLHQASHPKPHEETCQINIISFFFFIVGYWVEDLWAKSVELLFFIKMLKGIEVCRCVKLRMLKGNPCGRAWRASGSPVNDK